MPGGCGGLGLRLRVRVLQVAGAARDVQGDQGAQTRAVHEGNFFEVEDDVFSSGMSVRILLRSCGACSNVSLP